jgi:hypothetical protein
MNSIRKYAPPNRERYTDTHGGEANKFGPAHALFRTREGARLPQRIIVSSQSLPTLRITGAG